MNVQLDSRATGSGKIATIVYDRQSKLNSLNGAGIKESVSYTHLTLPTSDLV